MPESDQCISPATAKVSVTVPPVTISIRPNLSSHWTEITLRAEARAIEERRAGLASVEQGDGHAGFSADETYEAMVVVAAARSALTHLEADWRDLGYFGEDVESRDIPRLATTEPPQDIDGWLAEIKLLINDRIRIAHHPQPSTPGEPHPAYTTHVSSIGAYYTVERATSAVDLLLDFWHRVIDSPSESIAAWAKDRSHVPAGFDESRAAKRRAADS